MSEKEGVMGKTTITAAARRHFAEKQALVHAGRLPQWLGPEGYSRYLCAVWAGDDAELRRVEVDEHHLGFRPAEPARRPKTKAEREEAARVRHVAYQQGLQQDLAIMAPDGVYAARGLHGLRAMSGDEAVATVLAESRGKRYESYSLNVPKAVAFATPPRYWSKFVAEGLLGEDAPERVRHKKAKRNGPEARWEPDVDAWLRARGLRKSYATVKAAVEMLQMCMLLVARVPHDAVLGYGTDSESGPLGEAEIHVRPCDELSCVGRAYVLSAQPLDHPLATAAERREFALSFYDVVGVEYDVTVLDVPVHADVVCRSPRIVGRTKVRTVADMLQGLVPEPEAFRWYRVIPGL